MLSGAETQALHRMVLDDCNFQSAAYWRQIVLAASENPAVINAWHTSGHDLARRFHADLLGVQQQLAQLPSNEDEVWVDTVDAVNRLIDTCDMAGRRFEPRHKVISGLAVAHVFYLCAAMQHALGFPCTVFARENLARCESAFVFPPGKDEEFDMTVRLLATSAENYRKSEMAFAAAAEIYTAILNFMEYLRRELAQSAAPPISRLTDLFSGLGRFLKIGPGVVRIREQYDDATLADEIAISRDRAGEAEMRISALRRETDDALTQLAERNELTEA